MSRIVKELEEQYWEIENEYAGKEFQAHARSFVNKENYWQRKRELNTHAYFLFAFTQLEEHVTRHSKILIDKKKASINHWKTKAIWENTDHKNMHLMKKVGLLTEKGHAIYNTIKDYYDRRNDIAHGNLIPGGIHNAINMIDVFYNIKRYMQDLRA